MEEGTTAMVLHIVFGILVSLKVSVVLNVIWLKLLQNVFK